MRFMKFFLDLFLLHYSPAGQSENFTEFIKFFIGGITHERIQHPTKTTLSQETCVPFVKFVKRSSQILTNNKVPIGILFGLKKSSHETKFNPVFIFSIENGISG